MTQFRKITTATAILGVCALLSTGAFATTHNDMTCGEFNALDADGQKTAVMHMQGPNGGREAARDDASGTGDDTANDMASSSSEGVAATSGQEAAHDAARGDDMVASMVDHCKGGDDLMIKDVRHPSE
ncbi:HdeA/HdeB family chaperone [Roseovarius aestuarii]|nr:HdeA/HdeB family chaperone [Roseovarius aestuarii]